MVYSFNGREVEVRSEMRGGKGEVQISHVIKDGLPGKSRMLSEITIAPGGSIGYHVHEKETEIFIIKSGVALIDDNGEKVTAYPGDAVSTPDGCGHSVESIGDEPLVMTAVIVLD